MGGTDSLTDLPGIGPRYAKSLLRAGVASPDDLRERCATAQDRRVLAWETGISERLLEKWYRSSFPTSAGAPAREVDEEGVTLMEADLSVGPAGGAGRSPAGPAAHGRSLLGALGEYRLFALAAVASLVVALVGWFTLHVRSLSRETSPTRALLLGSKAGDPSTAPAPEAVRVNRDGESLFQIGEFEEARTRFEEAVRLDATFAAAWLNLGRALSRLQQFEGAEGALRRARDLDSRSVAPLYYLGHVAMARRDWVGAAMSCRSAIALDRSFRYAWFDLGILAYRSPTDVGLRSEEREPVVEALVLELGRSEPAEAAEAMAALRALTEVSPAPVDAAGWRAWLEERQGRERRPG